MLTLIPTGYNFTTSLDQSYRTVVLIARVRKKRDLVAENRLLKQQLAERFRFDSIISGSLAMEEALSYAGRVASSGTTVLVHGESGTGKELVALAIHQEKPS